MGSDSGIEFRDPDTTITNVSFATLVNSGRKSRLTFIPVTLLFISLLLFQIVKYDLGVSFIPFLCTKFYCTKNNCNTRMFR